MGEVIAHYDAFLVDQDKLKRLLRLVDELEWSGVDNYGSYCPICLAEHHLAGENEPHCSDCELDNVRREWEGFPR